MICVSWTILEFIDRRWLGANPYENKKNSTKQISTQIFEYSLSLGAKFNRGFQALAWSSAQPNKFQNLKGRILFLSVPEIGHCLKRTSSVAFESDCFSTEKRWAGQGNPYPIGENDSGIMQTFRGRIPLHPRLCSSQFQAAQLKTGEG